MSFFSLNALFNSEMHHITEENFSKALSCPFYVRVKTLNVMFTVTTSKNFFKACS